MVAGIRLHVVHQHRFVGHDHVTHERPLHRNQRTDGRQKRTRSSHHPHEAAFLHHQHDGAALGVQQFGRGLRHLTVQRRQVVAAKQRRRKIPKPVEFAVAARRRHECLFEGLVLPSGVFALPPQDEQSDEAGHRRRRKTQIAMTRGDQANGQPEQHQRDRYQGAGFHAGPVGESSTSSE